MRFGSIQVLLIDNGKVIKCELRNLFKYCSETAKKNFFNLTPRCFECRLTNVQPANGVSWSNELISLFKQKALGKEVEIEVRKKRAEIHRHFFQ